MSKDPHFVFWTLSNFCSRRKAPHPVLCISVAQKNVFHLWVFRHWTIFSETFFNQRRSRRLVNNLAVHLSGIYNINRTPAEHRYKKCGKGEIQNPSILSTKNFRLQIGFEPTTSSLLTNIPILCQ